MKRAFSEVRGYFLRNKRTCSNFSGDFSQMWAALHDELGATFLASLTFSSVHLAQSQGLFKSGVDHRKQTSKLN